MINIKLYVLKLNDKIFAISEEKYYIKLFILQNEFNKNIYSIENIKDNKRINKILIKYNDLMLMEYKKFIIRNIDYKYINNIYKEIKYKIQETIENLESINMTCIMSPKKHKLLSNSIDILDNGIKKKNIDDFINMNEIIRDYFNNDIFRNELHNLDMRYTNILFN